MFTFEYVGELLGPERPEISPEDEGKLRHDLLPLLHRVYASHHHPATYSAPMMMGSAFTADQTIYGIDPHGFNTSSPYVPSSDTESSGSGQVPSAPLAHSPKHFSATLGGPAQHGHHYAPASHHHHTSTFHPPSNGPSMGNSGHVTPTGPTATHPQSAGNPQMSYSLSTTAGFNSPAFSSNPVNTADVLSQAAAKVATLIQNPQLYGPITIPGEDGTALLVGNGLPSAEKLAGKESLNLLSGETSLLSTLPSGGENKHIFHMQLLKDCYKELAGEMSHLQRQIRDTSTLKQLMKTKSMTKVDEETSESSEEMEEGNNTIDENEEEEMEEVEEEAGHVMHEEDGEEEMSSPLLATKDTDDSESDDDNHALEEEVMLEGQL